MRIKKIILFCCSILFAASQVKGQEVNLRDATLCGFRYFDIQRTALDASYPTRKLQSLQAYKDYVAYWQLTELFHKVSDVTIEPVTIPVIFHRVGSAASVGNSGVSDNDIKSLLDDLNDLYANHGTFATGLGVDMQIKFCLPARDPGNNTTTGIESIPDQALTSTGPFCHNEADDKAIKSRNVAGQQGHSTWDVGRYLNIWLCNLDGCDTKSWGSDPDMFLSSSTDAFRDGVVCDIHSFDVKRIAHEIGHWMDLDHTFSDTQGDCTFDDGCDDTPFCSGTASTIVNCAAPTECSAENVTHNVMGTDDRRLVEDYMDDSPLSCKTLFTLQQKARAHIIFLQSHPRFNMVNSATAMQCFGDPTASCHNGVMDGMEADVDCGGPYCPPCPCKTIHFKINNRSTANGEVVNVCKEKILIEADCPDGGAGHLNALSTQGSGNQFVELNISLQLVDESFNNIGSEARMWFNVGGFQPSQWDVNTAINWFAQAPWYFVMNPGQIYRLIVRNFGQQGYTYGNGEWTAYFRIYDGPDITVSNYISYGRVGDHVSVNNAHIVSWLGYDVDIVGQSQIELLPTSDFNNGNFFLESFDCNSISSYRTMMPGANAPESSTNATPTQAVVTSLPDNAKASGGNTALNVNVIPNPFQGQCKVVIQNTGKYPKSISVQNVIGNTVAEYKNISSFENVVDLNDLPSGIYFVKVNFQDRTVSKKVIKE